MTGNKIKGDLGIGDIWGTLVLGLVNFIHVLLCVMDRNLMHGKGEVGEGRKYLSS